ncbi:MAG: fibronectin type III domain-containing protein [Saprospiraceae bacterium]|nr:fibronectin type III domain-containing protein [Saprospiraceae bacterium]
MENSTGFSRSGTIQLAGNQGASVQPIQITQNAAVVNCDIPTGLFASAVGYAYFELDWNEVPGATGYQTRIKEVSESRWTEGSILDTPGVTWGNTTPCEDYEVQVLAVCGGGRSEYSSSIFVKTDGCNDSRYCYSYGISWDDWIQRVQLSTINNTSGNNFGYRNFTNLSTNLRKGQTVTLTLAPGRDGENKPVYWRAWIDYNQDGDFLDANEQVAQITSIIRLRSRAASSFQILLLMERQECVSV